MGDRTPEGGTRPVRLALAAAMAVVGFYVLRELPAEFTRLIADPDAYAGIDLQLRLREVSGWWSGENVYKTRAHAVYPPSAYLLLRPLFVSLEWPVVRQVWGAWSALLLVVAAWGCVRGAGMTSWLGRIFAALLPLALAGTAHGIGNGQVSLLCTVAAVGSVLLVAREDAGWGTDLLAAGLFMLALIKPTMTAPFFWLICFLPGRWRPALLVLAGFGALTWASTLLVPEEGLLLLVARFVDRAVEGARYGATDGGTVNVQTVLGFAQMSMHSPVAALALVGGAGAWAAGRPTRDPWILMGVMGIAARIAFYHRSYDDLTVVPALIALARIATRSDDRRLAGLAGGLLVVTWLIMSVVPLGPLSGIADGAMWVCWVGAAALLVVASQRERPPTG